MPRPIIAGSHIFFAREGETIDGVTVSRTEKPDADPEENWTNLGVVESINASRTNNPVEFFRPSPGRKVLHDVIPTRQKLTHTVTMQEVSPLLLEIFYGSEEIDIGGGGNFEPLGVGAFVKGWFKIQHYDHLDQPFVFLDIFAAAMIDSFDAGDGSGAINFALTLEQLSAANAAVASNI